MTNAELQAFYNEHIKNADADDIAEDIYKLTGDPAVITSGFTKHMNEAVQGKDVRDDIVKLCMLLRAYNDIIETEANNVILTAPYYHGALPSGDLNNVAVDTIYMISSELEYSHLPPAENFTGVLYTVGGTGSGSVKIQYALGFSDGAYWYRNFNGTGWSDWTRPENQPVDDTLTVQGACAEAKTVGDKFLTTLRSSMKSVYITLEAFQEDFGGSSLDDIPANICIAIGNIAVTEKPTDDFRGYIWSISHDATMSTRVQFAVGYISYGSDIYYRVASGDPSTWGAWVKVTTASNIEDISETYLNQLGKELLHDVEYHTPTYPDGSTSGSEYEWSIVWDDSVSAYKFSGTSGDNSYVIIYSNRTALPDFLKKNKRYFLQINSSSQHILSMRIYWVRNGAADFSDFLQFFTDAYFTVPNDVDGLYIRIQAEPNTTASATIAPKIYDTAPPVTTLKNSFRSVNALALTEAEFIGTFGSSFDNIPPNICIAVGNTPNVTAKPSSDFRGYVWSVSNSGNLNGCVQFAVEYKSVHNKFYYRSAEGSWNNSEWHEVCTDLSDIEQRLGRLEEVTPIPTVDVTAVHNIILMGDSIVKGVGSADMSQDTGSTSPGLIHYPDTDGRDQHRNTGVEAWGARFVDYMDKRYGITVYNNGVGQITLKGMTDNFDYDPDGNTVYAKKGLGYLTPERDGVSTVTAPDLIICVAGINNRNSSDKTAFGDAVSDYIDKCQTANIPLIMLSPIDMGTYHSTFSTQPAMMNKIIRDVCYEKGVPFYDLYSEFNEMIAAGSSVTDFSGSGYATHVATYYEDGGDLHPSSKGHMLIFHCIRKLLHV